MKETVETRETPRGILINDRLERVKRQLSIIKDLKWCVEMELSSIKDELAGEEPEKGTARAFLIDKLIRYIRVLKEKD